jgi:hypothetical protein
MPDRWVDELMPDQLMWVRDLVDEELTRRQAEVERLTDLVREAYIEGYHQNRVDYYRLETPTNAADAWHASAARRAALPKEGGDDG